ncbi:sugar MFS transporter [uncultured Paraglaciecola sp.]|uniref:sugar MFS transporter n=1 Tax=uncultured Paraglaciecola sp. TaxID=1765024 RepID=UPI0030DCA30A|tara:strand:- start:224258 stop:225478 length:1221 start_codon:yes stop_codon:yes gene_type:complete
MAGVTPSSTTTSSIEESSQGQYRFAFIAMTFLFFFWGFITVLNDILIPHLKAAFDLNYTQAMLVQFCFFGAYFIISPFAGRIIDKIGYQRGIVLGLLTTASGCILFYPSAELEVYALFLFAFFVLASGITILQVAANPYVAALGPNKTAASRLNLAQALNSLGTTIGPILGAMLILNAATADAKAVQLPYLFIAAMLIIAALVFYKITLPVLAHVESKDNENTDSIWRHKSLLLGALAIFLYVGGEVSIGSFLVNYFAESSIAGLSEAEAGEMVAFYWGAAMVGRFIGAALMQYFSATRYLAVNSLIAIVMIVVSMNTSGSVAMWSILAVGFFNSIMFPTIFTLAIRGLGSLTSKGSGILCQAIVGGALIPVIQGVAADMWGIQFSFIIPLLCYLYIGWYALNRNQ